jgi:hypothetical protein
MKRSLLLFAALLGFAAVPARAALDPEVGKPYHLRVALHVADHRLLRGIFKDQVQRELQDSLQAALGPLATVEVVTEQSRKDTKDKGLLLALDKLKEARERGLQQTLDAWKDVSEVKTHFVLIDFVDGQYEIQLRQHDGLTGQASPTVRRERLDDRQFVARRVGQLIGEDFGPVGTVTDRGDEKTKIVKVALKGSALGAPLGNWVSPGEVFALVQISQSGGALRAYRVPWALLQVKEEPKDGVCTCQLFHRHPRPLDGGSGVVGYRCLKLSTLTKQPLRLQLVSANARKPVPEASKQIHVQKFGFDPEPNNWVSGITSREGFLSTETDKDKGYYDHVAFVLVLVGEEVKANIPVALVDDRPVVIPVALASEASNLLTDRKNFWTHQITEDLLVVADLLKELKDTVGKAEQRAAALEKVKATLKSLEEDAKRFEEARTRLEADAKESKVELNLADGNGGLQKMKTAEGILRQYADKLEKLVAQQDSPEAKELKAKLTQAQLAEEDADYDRALALYNDVIKAGAADEELKADVKKLQAAWQPRDEEHRQAREYIYTKWPAIDPVQMLPELPKLRKAFEKCQEVGDNLTPRKILTAALNHINTLQDRAKALRPEENEDDRNTARTIDEVKQQLTELLKAVDNFVNKGRK